MIVVILFGYFDKFSFAMQKGIQGSFCYFKEDP